MKTIRVVSALCAALISVFALSACGGVGDNDVAKVGSVDISDETFDHWASVAFKQQQQQSGGTGSVPVPPDFTACIAAKKQAAPKPKKGQPNTSDEEYKSQCKTEYESLRDSVMSLLINGEWIQGEAKDLDIDLSDEKVRKALITQKQQSFPEQKDYDAFIRQTGYTTEDLLYRVKIAELSDKIREKVTKGSDKVSESEMQAYYNKNKAQFGQPATRDIRIVLTKTKARAQAAKAALEGGQSWNAVAKQYSTDSTSKNKGGQLSGVTQGQLETELDKAVFGAKKGVIGGPVKTQFGYYVYEVDKITKGTQQSFDEVKEQVKSNVAQQNEQKKLNDFVKKFEKKWRDKTECASKFKVTECKNGPKPNTSSTVAPGAVPQNQNPAPADGSAQ